MVIENKNSLRTIRLNIKANVSNKHVCTNHPVKLGAMYIFRIATRVQTSEIVLYILPIDKWNDVQKLPFQLAKMKETNRTDVSLNFEFSNRHVYTARTQDQNMEIENHISL